jgi:hypothetical protein
MLVQLRLHFGRGMFQVITPTYRAIQNLKDSENKRKILHYTSIVSTAMVCEAVAYGTLLSA